jgi:crossover junction endodeoxyribonuclease RusA
MIRANKVTVTPQVSEHSLTYAIELPWPAKELSPNARQHWSAAARAKKAYRLRCKAVGDAAGLALVPKGATGVLVHLVFIKPDRRARDWDNMLASMKSGLDGLADAMGVDDSMWRLSFDVADEPVPAGAVLVTIEVRS